MKKNTLITGFSMIFILFFSTGACFAATRTASKTGNWNNTDTWGGEAMPTSADDVIINSGRTVTVNIADAECASLTFATVNANSALTISGTNALTITGLLNMPRPAAGNNCTVNVKTGSVSCGSLTMSATTAGKNDIINIITGTLTVSGALTTGTTGCQITFTDTCTFNLGGALTGSPSLTTFAGSNVNYTGSDSQTIITAAYIGNLGMSGAGTKTMNGSSTVYGTLYKPQYIS